MKKVSLFSVAIVSMVMQSVTCLADDMVIPVGQLPEAAKTFVKKNFPNTAISYVTKEMEFMGATYEARLADGTEIDFDKKGNWDKVDCQLKAVPAALIPATISQFVKTNHPDAIIVKIDKERYGYDIELSNDLELKFNKKGQLIGIDD
ncbi:MAG: PepSY-like domain-containing protein [Prevotella sp.]|nr:PepSY-like domain-containing protein [Prevotella sp.]